jgi:hypothetical protein
MRPHLLSDTQRGLTTTANSPHLTPLKPYRCPQPTRSDPSLQPDRRTKSRRNVVPPHLLPTPHQAARDRKREQTPLPRYQTGRHAEEQQPRDHISRQQLLRSTDARHTPPSPPSPPHPPIHHHPDDNDDDTNPAPSPDRPLGHQHNLDAPHARPNPRAERRGG